MLNGREFEYGSTEERIAIHTQKRLDRITRLETMMLIKANTTIVQAVVNPEEVKMDDLNKLIQQYSDLMFPELERDREDKADEIKKIMIRESRKKLRITPVSTGKSNKRLRKKV